MPFAGATLSIYIARVFSVSVTVMTLALAALVMLFDFIELLRRAAARPDAGFALVARIAALRLPWIGMEVLPFGVLLGGILAFWRLTRSSELIVARSAGVSAWQFLAAPVACAFGFGLFAIMAVSPVSAVMRAQAEALDSTYLRSGGGPLSVIGGQLWLRQADHGLDPQGVAIIHAAHVALEDGTLSGRDASIFRLGPDDRLIQRIEAPRLELQPGGWVLESARVVALGRADEPGREVDLPTDFTVSRVQESFAPPDTFSLWALPPFISALERAGFSAVRHRLHFNSLLALPLLSGTMCLLAAAFSMRPTRRGGVAQMLGSGVAAGFLLFVTSKVAQEFGQSGALPAALAAWAPAVAGLLIAISLLLHLEDG